VNLNLHESRITFALKLITTLCAAFYATSFLVVLNARFNAPQVSNIVVDWNVPQNPRFAIALILVTATALLWVLRGSGQGIVAILLASAVAVKVFFWWESTKGIKTNTGLAQIPGANWIGNLLIGAGPAEIVALLATLNLLAFGIMSLLMRHEKLSSRQLHTLHP
jgi:hypothetical protein